MVTLTQFSVLIFSVLVLLTLLGIPQPSGAAAINQIPVDCLVEASNADAKTLLGHSALLVRSIVLTGEPVFDPNCETLVIESLRV